MRRFFGGDCLSCEGLTACEALAEQIASRVDAASEAAGARLTLECVLGPTLVPTEEGGRTRCRPVVRGGVQDVGLLQAIAQDWPQVRIEAAPR